MVDPKDLDGTADHAVRYQVGGVGNHEFPGARNPSRPPDLGRRLEHLDRGAEAPLKGAGGGGILGEDTQINLAQIAPRLRRPLRLQVAPAPVSNASISAMTSSWSIPSP